MLKNWLDWLRVDRWAYIVGVIGIVIFSIASWYVLKAVFEEIMRFIDNLF